MARNTKPKPVPAETAEADEPTPRKRKGTSDASIPRNVPRPLELKPKKKTAAELKAERTTRKKKAATDTELRTYNLRNKILDLREQGATIRQISETLITQGETGCGPTMIFNHLEAGLDHVRKEFTLKYKNFIQVRLNQMYRVELAHFKRMCDARISPDDFEKLSRGMDRIWKRMDDLIDRLTDNHKTTKVEVTGEGGGPVQTITRIIMPPGVEPDDEEPLT